MPHPTVHTHFKARVPDVSGVPFQETQGILRTQKGLPEVWCTLEYDDASTQRLTLGQVALWREYGTATVVFLAKAGHGPDELLRIGQAFADAMRADYQNRLTEENGVIGTLRIENVGSPNPEPFEDGNWLVCSVACVYTYDSVRGADQQVST